MNDLETLLDFIQSATKELQWLNEKEEEEITRDWSDTKMNVNSIEKHFEVRYFVIIQLYSSFCGSLFCSFLYFRTLIIVLFVSAHEGYVWIWL